MVIYNRLTINDVEYTDAIQILLNKNTSDFNSTSSFTVELRNDNGQYDNTFALNNGVEISAGLGVEETIESYTTGADATLSVTGALWGAQTFTIGNTGQNKDTTLVTVRLKLKKLVANDADNTFHVSIKAVDGNGKPTGTDLSTGSIHSDDLTYAFAWYDISMTRMTLDESTQYTIVMKYPTGSGVIVIHFDTTLATYTGGTYVVSANSGVDWTIGANDDFLFEVIGYLTPKIFAGVIESIRFRGKGQDEKVFLRGRDYGAILQDIMVSPRIFKETETSEIITSLLNQNARDTGLTYNNVDTTTTTVDKITFSNTSLFDALKELSSISGYYFWVDVDKDLNFKQKESVSSGLTFDNTNVTKSNFKRTDSDVFNYITVYGDRQLTGAIETFGPQAGSAYILDAKPYNVSVIGSANPNVPIQPGGILNINDPETDDVQFLVNFQGQQVILTSGTTGGYNTGWIGSSIIVDYQRSSPLLSIRQNSASQAIYGMKQKIIVDTNIKDLDEANTRAATFLAEHKNPITMGDMNINGVLDVTPGETCIVDIPFHGINNSTYTILSASYIFNPQNNLIDNVLKLTVNRSLKTKDFIDIFKVQELRIRALEGANVDTAITNVELGVGSVAVAGSYVAVRTNIGSSFYFHVPGHNLFNSDTSLLGDMRAGSTFKEGSW